MIKTTDTFFEKAKEYQDARNSLEDKYLADMKALKKHEGSEYFEEQTEKLTREYENHLTALKTEAARSINVIVTGMMDIIERTPATAPTTEQLNLLSVLKMRNKISKEDLDATAESLKGCPIALKTLSEIALEKGFMGYERFIDEMTTEAALDICNSPWIKDFIDYNTPRAARIIGDHNKRMYGEAATVSRARRKPFTDKEGCFKELMGLDGARLQHFCNIVDREVTA